MPLNFRAFARVALVVSLPAGLALTAPAQNAFSPGGADYAIAGQRLGDQTAPDVAVHAGGGWLVWQDNAADGDGLGISAARLSADFQRVGDIVRVNQQGAHDQEKPRVTALPNGGAMVVWQGGRFGFQKIYARVLGANGQPAGGDILVNTYTNHQQTHPAIATLADGNVVVVWQSLNQDGSLFGIYGQRLTASGQKLGGEFRINQAVLNNQRTPDVAALPGGGFVVAWVSELQRSSGSIDVYARRYDTSGAAVSPEFAVNPTTETVAANPAIAAVPQGGFVIAWSQRDNGNPLNPIPANSSLSVTAGPPRPNGWDVFARFYDAAGASAAGPVQLNTVSQGDQYAPRVRSFGRNYLATWVSLGQDGSREGIYAQFFNDRGILEGVEFRVNTVTTSRQIHPALGTDGLNRFVAVWTSFHATTSFDLVARVFEIIRTQFTAEAGGLRMTWNTQPGCVYQVQAATVPGGWTNHGPERAATGTSDSILIHPTEGAAYYRVVRVR